MLLAEAGHLAFSLTEFRRIPLLKAVGFAVSLQYLHYGGTTDSGKDRPQTTVNACRLGLS